LTLQASIFERLYLFVVAHLQHFHYWNIHRSTRIVIHNIQLLPFIEVNINLFQQRI
jgi:hypothetical protein